MRKKLTTHPRFSVAAIEEVRALLRETGLSAVEIAKKTGVSESRVLKEGETIVRPKHLLQAARRARATAAAAARASWKPRVDRDRMRALLASGLSATEVAVEMRCSTRLVYAERKHLVGAEITTYRAARGLVHDVCADADTERV